MGFGRNPADWDERWTMAKDRARPNEERLALSGGIGLNSISDPWR